MRVKMIFSQFFRNFVRSLAEILPLEQYRKIDTWLRKHNEETRMSEQLYGHFVHRKRGAKEKYVICRFGQPEMSVMAVANYCIFTADHLGKKGYIPIFDLEWGTYYEEGRLGEDNAWDYCFEQSISVKDALSKEWVYVDTLNSPHIYRNKLCRKINKRSNDNVVHCREKGWRKYYSECLKHSQPLWKWKKDVMDIYAEQAKSFFGNSETILAVMMREEFSEDAYRLRDMVDDKVYRHHPRLPSIDETIQIVRGKMKEWNCQKIFLATVVHETVEKFQKTFGMENVFFIQRSRHRMQAYSENVFKQNKEERKRFVEREKGGERERLVAYVTEIHAVAEADYLVAARCSGTAGALTINGGKYKDIYLLEDRNPFSQNY